MSGYNQLVDEECRFSTPGMRGQEVTTEAERQGVGRLRSPCRMMLVALRSFQPVVPRDVLRWTHFVLPERESWALCE